MDQQPTSMPPSQIDKNIVQLTKTLESVYGNPWDIIWRNFLAGFMRVLGMAIAYIMLLVVIFFVISKTGALTYVEGLWKNITNDLINDVQKNVEKKVLQNPLDQNMLQQLIPEQINTQ